GTAAFGKFLFQPPQHHATQADLQAQLLQLLQEGKLTPEQAVQLAQLLQAGAVGTTQTASANDRSAAGPAPSAAPSLAEDQSSGSASGDATVTEASFTSDAQAAYNEAFAKLLQHPDPAVRTAALQMTQDATRNAGIQAIWTYAQTHPDDPERADMYLVCGAIG